MLQVSDPAASGPAYTHTSLYITHQFARKSGCEIILQSTMPGITIRLRRFELLLQHLFIPDFAAMRIVLTAGKYPLCDHTHSISVNFAL